MTASRLAYGRGLCALLPILLLITDGNSPQAGGNSASRPINAAKAAASPLTAPIPGLLTAEEQDAVDKWKSHLDGQADCFKAGTSVTATRDCVDARFAVPLVEKLKARYAVRIKAETIAQVNAEIITPVEGVSRRHQDRVLLNLHGGAFMLLGRYGGQIESIAIAATGRYKVIGIDYRMAPEHKFPAASEDAVAVYRALLKDYKPENIGVYGCSAGGLLTAEVLASLQKQRLPRPGAVGMFCGAASYWADGDSGRVRVAGAGAKQVDSSRDNPYFAAANPEDPLAFPLRSREIMSRFPPSLLISSMRDVALSSVVQTHSRLIKYGVEAELHIWEALDHAFLYDPELPQSRDAYDVIVAFFDKHLGKH